MPSFCPERGVELLAGVSVIRQLTTQQHLRFNPAFITRFTSGFNQPLLNGRGFIPNMRFVYVAENNLKTSEQIFRLQVTTTLAQVEDAYWDLAGFREAVLVAEGSLTVAKEPSTTTTTAATGPGWRPDSIW